MTMLEEITATLRELADYDPPVRAECSPEVFNLLKRLFPPGDVDPAAAVLAPSRFPDVPVAVVPDATPGSLVFTLASGREVGVPVRPPLRLADLTGS